MKYRWDDFLLDVEAYRVERAGAPVPLEPKAFDLLALFVSRPGHLFTKQAIFDAVWPGTAVSDHALTRVVAQLRRMLGDEAREATYIETIPTRGYRWIRPVERVDHVHAAPPAAPVLGLGAVPIDAAAAKASIFPRVAAALLIGSVLLAGIVWVQRSSSTAATTRERGDGGDPRRDGAEWPVQLTTHPGLDLQPALSPHGDAVAYVSDRSGAFEIYVRSLGGTATETPLTSDGGHNMQPAWSPDGRLLAYHSSRRGGIWVMPSRGGVPRQVVSIGSNPSWSPDGRRIAYQSDEHTDITPSAYGAQSGSTIWMVHPDGSDPREVTSGTPLGGHAAPAWSSGGRYLAFTVFEAGPDNGVWVLTLDSGEVKPLARGPGLYELVFAPDDTALYAAGGEPVITRLPFDAATATLAGAREVIPIPGVSGVRGLTMSRDGRHLSFAAPALSSQIWAQPVSADGSAHGPATPLTRDTSRRNSLPVVSPDGRKVAYMSTRSGGPPNVWVMDIDGRNGMQVTSDDTAEFKPNWFPDSARVAYLSSRGESLGIWAVDISTRSEQLWLDATRAQAGTGGRLPGRLAEFDLAASATRAAFSLLGPAGARRVVYVTTIAPFTPRAVSDGTQSVGYPTWSPDERRLGVEVKEGSSTHAGVIDVATGTLRVLTQERGQTWVRGWSPDGRKLAMAALREGLWSLQWLDVDGGGRGIITPPAPANVYMRYPEWSPRGGVIVFERGELRGNIWMLTLPPSP